MPPIDPLTYLWLLPAGAVFCWVFAIGNTSTTELPDTTGSARAKRQELLRESLFFQIGHPIIRALARIVALFRPSRDDDPLVKKLVLAGQPGGLCPEEFLALSLFGIIGAPIVGWVLLAVYGQPFSLLTLFAFAAFGAVVPYFRLNERIATRRAEVMRALPFVLDNLTMSMEGGLDFGASVERFLERAKKKRTAIEEELHIVLQETRMGKTRAESLTAFSERVDSPDVKSFVGAVIQGERLGTPLGQILRVQSEALRVKRFQRAEKLAGEAPVKILFPLLFVMAAVILTVFGGTIVRAMKGELL